MLWDRLIHFREIISVLFCFIFSISSLVWNANIAVQAASNSRKLGNFLSSSFNFFSDSVSKYTEKLESYESIKNQRDDYLKRIEKYEYLLEDRALLKNENEKLRELLEFNPRINYSVIKAKVLTVRLNTIYRIIIINKGSSSGVQLYMPVIARLPDDSPVRMAVVGKVISVNEDTSIIQPLINSGFTMGVKLSESSSWALLSGNSDKSFQVMLNYIDYRAILSTNPTEQDSSLIGKPVFSSSGSGIFPANIPVGLISAEGDRDGSFRTAYVEPFIKFSNLEYVTIIKKLPDKWLESYPKDKQIPIADPILAEPIYPEDGFSESNLRPVQENKSKVKTTKSKTKTPQKDSRLKDEDEEEILMRSDN